MFVCLLVGWLVRSYFVRNARCDFSKSNKLSPIFIKFYIVQHLYPLSLLTF